jgi:hypothetical protein
MQLLKKREFKKGAASFYIVAFSTLILLVVVVSFATIIISEIERASNDDLSQSAYDSALAGVEDAKVALSNYQKCKESGKEIASEIKQDDSNLTCEEIIAYVENPKYQDCDMVGHILGRIGKGESKEVEIEDAGDNKMQQAYTCVKLQTTLNDYRSTLSSSQQTKVVKVKFDGDTGENVADKITKVKISWYTNENDLYTYSNLLSSSAGAKFYQLGLMPTAVPSTISLAMIQTGTTFSLKDFDVTTSDGQTNRGMLYLVPTDEEAAKTSKEDNYIGAWNGTINEIGAEGFLKSNDKTATNLPYGVNCPERMGNEFACSVEIELPEPVGGERNEDTFLFVVSLPYGKPSTDFSLEFFCDGPCTNKKILSLDDDGEVVETENDTSQARLSGTQVKVDSTGRANDLFRRVETRLESEADSSYLSIMGPLELLGNSSSDDSGLNKEIGPVTKEYNF